MATIGAGHSASDATNQQKDDKLPEQYISEGMWEVEPLYYSSHNGRPLKRGKAYRRVDSGDYVCFEASDSLVYRIGDNVYLDSQQSELAFFVCNITGFKMTKKEQLNAQVKWFYRPSEVPETVYHTLVQDRHTEHSQKETQRDLCIKDPTVRCRELFISDAQDVYPISALRGQCEIKHYKDIGEACDFVPVRDSFFYILGYNPENNRLANIQGEIRIGPSHQAKLPPLRCEGKEGGSEEEEEIIRETLAWSPYRIGDTDLMMFLRAARSMAAFAGMCDGGTTEDGCLAASRDDTTINALAKLHDHKYISGEALQKLVHNPVPVAADKKWTEEETKKFMKGLKQWGKNFFKIRKELLTHKTTSELVEFYYLWKKTPQAQGSQRPRPRQRRPQTTILRRVRPGNNNNKEKPSRPASSEFLDASSASENEFDSEDSESKDLTGYACHHCYATTSKNWHHAGKERALLCYDCRIWFKKYGELRPVDRAKTMPPCLFKPVKAGEDSDYFTEDVLNGVKTRTRSCKDLTVLGKQRQGSPVVLDADLDRKSPGAYSTTSSGSSTAELTEKSPRKTPGKGKRKGKKGSKSKRNEVEEEPANKRSRQSASTSEQASGEESAEDNNPKEIKAEVEDTKENIKKELDAYEFHEDTETAEVKATSSYKAQTQGSLLSPDKDSCTPIDPPLLPPSTFSQSPPATPNNRVCTSVIQLNQTQPLNIKSEVTTIEDDDCDQGLVMQIGEPPAMKEPDAKIDDTILSDFKNFRRHWYRGENNSCARTDLTYIIDESRETRRPPAVNQPPHQKNVSSKTSTSAPRIKQEPGPSHSNHSNRPPVSPAVRPMPPPPAASANHYPHSIPPGMSMQSPHPMHPHPMSIPNPYMQQSHNAGAAASLKAYAERAQQGPTQNQLINMAMQDAMIRNRMFDGPMAEPDRMRLHEAMVMREREQQQMEQMMADSDLAERLKMAQAQAAQTAQPPRPTPSAGPSAPPHTPRTPQSFSQGPPFQMDPRDPRAAQFMAMQQSLAMAGLAGPNAQALMSEGNWNRLASGQMPHGFIEAMNADRSYLERIQHLEQRERIGDRSARPEIEQLVANANALIQQSPQHHTHSHTHTHLHLHGTPPVSAAPTTAPAGLGMFGGSQAHAEAMQSAMGSPGSLRFPGPSLPTVNSHNELLRMSAMHGFPFGHGGGGHMAADQLMMQMRQHEIQQMAMMRDRQAIMQAAGQQHSDMMRRLQREGGVTGSFGVMRPPHPS